MNLIYEPSSSSALMFMIFHLQIHQGDRLSARVCHACISYLNSWQSFKNRCYAAQKKQRGMLDMFLAKERARLKNVSQQQQTQPQAPAVVAANAQRQMEQYRQQLEQQRILKDALSQPSGSSAYKNAQNNASVDVVCVICNLFPFEYCSYAPMFRSQSFIKSEPADDIQNDAEIEDDEDMDPSQFLARENEDDETGNEEDGGPPILTSLGLTHINHVNPYSFLVSLLSYLSEQTVAFRDSNL